MQLPPPDALTVERRRDLDEGLEHYDADTTRLWISEQQWIAILQDVEHGPTPPTSPVDSSPKPTFTERGSSNQAATADTKTPPPALLPFDLAGGAGDASGQRDHARHALSFRCVLRLAPPDQPDADHGTYLVVSRNISTGGLGFAHHAALQPGTRCTVALQPAQGRGVIVAARVAWCREIPRHAEDTLRYDIGVEFHRPLDIRPFSPAA